MRFTFQGGILFDKILLFEHDLLGCLIVMETTYLTASTMRASGWFDSFP